MGYLLVPRAAGPRMGLSWMDNHVWRLFIHVKFKHSNTEQLSPLPLGWRMETINKQAFCFIHWTLEAWF